MTCNDVQFTERVGDCSSKSFLRYAYQKRSKLNAKAFTDSHRCYDGNNLIDVWLEGARAKSSKMNKPTTMASDLFACDSIQVGEICAVCSVFRGDQPHEKINANIAPIPKNKRGVDKEERKKRELSKQCRSFDLVIPFANCSHASLLQSQTIACALYSIL